MTEKANYLRDSRTPKVSRDLKNKENFVIKVVIPISDARLSKNSFLTMYDEQSLQTLNYA